MLAKGPRLLADEIGLEFKDETQDEYKERKNEEKKEKYGHPLKDIEELLKEVGVEEEGLKKLNEEKIGADTFWDIEDDKLAETLKIENFVVKKALLDAFKKMKQDHAEMIELKEEQGKNLTDE